jgi:hypothetical protein
MWNHARFILPAIFLLIVGYQLYGYIRPSSYEVRPPRDMIVARAGTASEPVAADPEEQIKSEFNKLGNVLTLVFKQSRQDPPANLTDALNVVWRAWPDNQERFEDAFPFLNNSQSPGSDPWGQPCQYRVDLENLEIVLRSFGSNRQSDEVDPENEANDDVVVTIQYGAQKPSH